MIDTKQVTVIDAGNTRLKLGVFLEGELLEVQFFKLDEVGRFKDFLSEKKIEKLFISSVLSDEMNEMLFGSYQVDYLTSETPLPFINAYESPETLGKDRIANAAYAASMQKGHAAAVLDMGTCIKWDLVDENGTYLGGSISPGLEMRYKAMHTFTGKLPLLQPKKQREIGRNSADSMHAGVYQGIEAEINALIMRYKAEFQGLTIFVTGGDSNYFEFPSKSNIFASENLTLKGLFYIYQLNA
ncbi:MAG: type III pantothenate kinase [Crocinitomicaceae bacterium]|jgi:type III pantothenate kinase|nr:type III pantothenate kinase [Crocinitomicaceae bacterium]